jgi:glucuronate isomerase
MLESLSAAAGCFRNVNIGAAWWFNDHTSGIVQTLETIAHSGNIGSFIGMLTDSRSFLSYARHDYFRRILCSVIGRWVEIGEFCGDAEKLCRNISSDNIKRLIEG